MLSINYTVQLNFTFMNNYSFSVGEFVHLEVLAFFPIKSFWGVGVEHIEKKKKNRGNGYMHSLYCLFTLHLFVFLDKHRIANSWISFFCELSGCLSNSAIKETIIKL